MCENDFVHLHVHTDSSLIDGLGTPNRLVSAAKDLGFGALAITDHGTLSNAVQFSIECDWADIKPILGLEGYINVEGETGHITLLANGQAGWESLVKLNNIAQINKTGKNPIFTLQDLLKNNNGLFCLSGCVASPIHKMGKNDSLMLTKTLAKVFGERFWLELMFNSAADSFSRPMWLHEQTGIPFVVTNDVHFPYSNDSALHKHLTRIKSGFDYDSSDLWLKTGSQILQTAVKYGANEKVAKEGVKNAFILAEKLEKVKLKKEAKLPTIEEEKLGEFKNKIFEGFASLPQQYQDRLNFEVGVIERMNYLSYFYILSDIVDHSRQNGVKVGPGRGSGAGSLVLYQLGITKVDPIKHGLSFERFLNPERVSMPDVDLDFAAEKRDIVLDYATKKWGGIPIVTYSTYGEKSLIRDLGKYYKMPQSLINQAADNGRGSAEFKKMCDDNPDFLPLFEAMEGQKRHKGKHAAGMIITDVAVPLERVGDVAIAGWSEGGHSDLSYAGVVKFDILGVQSLSSIGRMEQLTGQVAKMPDEDPLPFEIFKNGDLVGVFQFAGSDGIKQLTMQLQPDTIGELCAINALYRPGAIDSGTTEMFPRWKHEPRKVPEYIEDILGETFGAIVYQEQFMSVYAKTVGGTLADADIVRRLLAKGKGKENDPKWLAEFEDCKSKFLQGATKTHGLTEEEAAGFWHELETHSRYSFNKSHAMAYVYISWAMAWFKYHWPVQFYTAMLNTDPDQVQSYMFDAAKKGISIKPPHVNFSSCEYETDGESIYMPLTSVKFLGLSGAASIAAEREKHGRFSSIQDFMKRIQKKIVKSTARKGLYCVGSLEGLGRGADFDWVDLGLKEKPETMGRPQTYMQYFGFYLPSKKLTDLIALYEKNNAIVGVLSKVERRINKRGQPYDVYTVEPSGKCWSFDTLFLQKGDLVAMKIDGRNGRLLKSKVLNIDE